MKRKQTREHQDATPAAIFIRVVQRMPLRVCLLLVKPDHDDQDDHDDYEEDTNIKMLHQLQSLSAWSKECL